MGSAKDALELGCLTNANEQKIFDAQEKIGNVVYLKKSEKRGVVKDIDVCVNPAGGGYRKKVDIMYLVKFDDLAGKPLEVDASSLTFTENAGNYFKNY